VAKRAVKVNKLALGMEQVVTRRLVGMAEPEPDVVVLTWSDGTTERFTEVSTKEPAVHVDEPGPDK
jgi:predicted NAD/FAD-binding protein